MQKLTALLLLFVLAASVVNAADEFKIENGTLLVSPSKWSATGVKVTPEAQKYPLSVEEAFNNPGKLVATRTEGVYTVANLFHLKVDTISKFGVRYDTQQAVVDVVASGEVVRTRVRISPFPFLWMVTIVAFLVSTTTKKGNKVVALHHHRLSHLFPHCRSHGLFLFCCRRHHRVRGDSRDPRGRLVWRGNEKEIPRCLLCANDSFGRHNVLSAILTRSPAVLPA